MKDLFKFLEGNEDFNYPTEGFEEDYCVGVCLDVLKVRCSC